MTNLGSNGLDLCPKCGGETGSITDAPKPYGFCSKCQWFTSSLNSKHNTMMIQMTASLSMLTGLIDSMEEDEKAGRDSRDGTTEIANNLMKQLRSWE